MTLKSFRIGTRTSALALKQTDIVIRALKMANPTDIRVQEAEIVGINTTGDKIKDKSLADIGGKALFAKEIHEALLENRIDCGIHSLKDLETTIPAGIHIASVLKREDCRDVLISRKRNQSLSLSTLKTGAVVGTCSPRRAAQLLYHRPDLQIVSLRGNVPTRLRKLCETELDAIILAAAGLKRLGLWQDKYLEGYPTLDATILSTDEMIPAAGQGVIAVDCRVDDIETFDLLHTINHIETEICIRAERALSKELSGDCYTPVAALAIFTDNDELFLRARYAPVVSEKCFYVEGKGDRNDPENLGISLGQQLKLLSK